MLDAEPALPAGHFFSDRPQAGLEPTLHVALLHQSPFCKKFSRCEVPASVAGGRGDFKGEDSPTNASLVHHHDPHDGKGHKSSGTKG